MGISGVKFCVGVQTVLLVFTCGVDGVDNLKCEGTTFYRVKDNGQASCRECKACVGGGIGWNTTVKREEDEHGFRSCFPCARCASGTYRELDSTDSNCQPCSLDCRFANRYESVRCGGSTPGHCGECRTGYTTDSKEPNSLCTRPPTPQEEEMPFTESPKQRPPPRTAGPENPARDGDYLTSNLSVWILFGTLFVMILIMVACAIIGAKHKKSPYKKKKTDPSKLENEVQSSKALISSGSSFGEENDIEEDGPKRNEVRGEQPECVTIDELEAIGFTETVQNETNHNQNTKLYDRVLAIDDETLTIVSIHVSGERRHELFQTYLKLQKSKIEPWEELWEKNKITFIDYILEVMKIWLQKAGKEATLSALCNALKMASFDEVVDMIQDLPENQAPRSDLENDEAID